MDAVHELNYSPNRFARGLRTNRTFSVALIGDSLQTELFESISVELFRNGYYPSLFYAQHNDSFVQRIIEGQFDAIFMTSNGFSSDQLTSITESGIPLILYRSRVYRHLPEEIVTMAPDFADGMVKAVTYLISRGHERIALIPALRYKTKGLGGDDYRTQGYEAALRAHGITPDPALVCTHSGSLAEIEEEVHAMVTAADEASRPTAMMVADDELAAELMQYLRTLGIRVPEQMAIVGWGDIPVARITSPQLTTVNSLVREFASEVSAALIAYAGGRRPDDRTFPVELVVRGSA